MRVINNTFRDWLIKNNYEDIAKMIEEILIEWSKKGIKTRRNWWDILAGGQNGKERNICGRQIPVLKAAQIRQGVKVTENALCRDENELKNIPLNKKNVDI